MKRAALFFWILGFLVVLGLIIHQGAGNVFAAATNIGWGLLAVCLYQVLPLAASAACWRRLLPPDKRPSLLTLLRLRWICGSVNSLLPVAQVGGEYVRVRLLSVKGVPGTLAAASVVADVTVAIVCQSVFGFVSILLLFLVKGPNEIVFAAVIGLAFFSVLILGFYMAQRLNLFTRLAHKLESIVKVGVGDGQSLVGNAAGLDRALDSIYTRRKDLIIGFSWRFLGLLANALQIVIIMYFLENPVSIIVAIVLEGLTQAVRNASFIIPGALGVQEGSYMLLSILFGIAPETGLALALIVRARSILTGLPAILLWQITESKHLLNKSDSSEG